MSTAQVKRKVEQYAEVLRGAGFQYQSLYLFGSHAKGEGKEQSDIDVAVISPVLADETKDEEFMLWRLRRKVDTRIEPHGFTPDEFANDIDPMVHEIKKTGVRIT